MSRLRNKKNKRINKKIPKIDFHGATAEECRERLSKVLSDCFQNNIKELIIIHGHGTGKIKKTVTSYLDSAGLDLSYNTDPFNSGQIKVYFA